MSADVTSWVLRESPTKGTERLVLLVLADAADPDGTNAWPSVATIAERANVSRRRAQKALRTLEEQGHITIEEGMGGGIDTRGDRRPNRYTVIVPEEGVGRRRTPTPNGANKGTPRQGNGANTATPRSVERGEQTDIHGVNTGTPYQKQSLYQELKTKETAPPPTPPKGGRRVYTDDFQAFWQTYPRRPDNPKKPAFDVWSKRVAEGAEPSALIAAAGHFAEWVAQQEVVRPDWSAGFVPHARTWLNQYRDEGWDAPPPPLPRFQSPVLRAAETSLRRLEVVPDEPAADTHDPLEPVPGFQPPIRRRAGGLMAQRALGSGR